jgi:hypothetical protein
VIGLVTSKPGTYSLTISVDAMQPGALNPVPMSQQLPVTVK